MIENEINIFKFYEWLWAHWALYFVMSMFKLKVCLNAFSWGMHFSFHAYLISAHRFMALEICYINLECSPSHVCLSQGEERRDDTIHAGLPLPQESLQYTAFTSPYNGAAWPSSFTAGKVRKVGHRIFMMNLDQSKSSGSCVH